MFGKLLKHELRHTARYHFAIIIVSVIATLFMGVSLVTESEALMSMAMFPLILIAAAVIIVSLVSIIKNFYETIFSRQGYLTMTLPVRGSQLLISKVLISFFWVIVSYIAAFLPFVFVFLHVKKQLDADNMTDQIVQDISSILPSTGSIVLVVIFFVITSLISILSYVSYVYFSVTIANTRLLNKHPKLFGGLIFLGVSILTGKISDFTLRFAPLSFAISDERAFFTFKDAWELEEVIINTFDVNSYLIEAIVAVALLFATGYFIENKINIK
jgi:hypothetical protein